MNRKLWDSEFTRNVPPKWPCHNCGVASLKIRASHFLEEETLGSLEARDELAWEPDWINGRFACILGCQHCGAPTGVTGRFTSKEFYDFSDQSNEPYLETTYRAEFLTDVPDIIHLPSKTPTTVADELRRAFRLFWSDLGASGNAIRSSVEELLSSLKIPRTRVTGAGKRTRISLHERIVRLKSTRPDISESLEAVKWIGNAASHASGLTQEDVLDGFEIIEEVLDQLYVNRSKQIQKIAQKINRRKKPRSRGGTK